MTMTVIDRATGTRYRGRSARDLLHKIHASSMAPSLDDATFMRDMADRALLITGKTVPSDTPDKFIAGLVKTGLFKKENE